jgi:hypothetical protein
MIVRVVVAMSAVRSVRRDPTHDFGSVRTFLVANLGLAR